jgi:hypothetical protein
MTIILQEHARREILADFKQWSAARLNGRLATGRDGELYFSHLREEKGQLLQFRFPARTSGGLYIPGF